MPDAPPDPPPDAARRPAEPPEARPAGDAPGAPWKRWLARFGVAGFLFFLIKGLLWLIVPVLLVTFGVQCS